MNKVKTHLLLALFSLPLIGWISWQHVKAQGADWLPVKYVRIEGAFQYISKRKIKTVIKEKLMNGLYNVDIQQIRQLLKHLPWVRKVTVKRVWPDAIIITIKEQVAIARWGKTDLLNRQGQLFKPDNIKQFTQLPLLDGPANNEKVLLSQMHKMSVALTEQKLILTEFHVSERRAWKLKLANKMEINLGSKEQKKKFKRFLSTFALIGAEQIKKVRRVDLRYVNGYALTWKQGEDKIDWQQVAELNKT